jgi:hypothetical protein
MKINFKNKTIKEDEEEDEDTPTNVRGIAKAK